MTPLDLTKEPPRSPREELGGLCMLPRMIDVARARLPGGDIGEYQIGRGMSGLVLRHLGMEVGEFVELVRNAKDDEEVWAQLGGLKTEKENGMVSLRLRRVTVKDVPDDLRESFVRFYGADLSPEKRVMDVLEEDDARAFGPK
ncbi:MAG: DUF5069 domain-containing protein [Chthoniobacterales bacterium]